MKNKQRVWISLIFSVFVITNECISQQNISLNDKHTANEINNINTFKSLSALDSNKRMIDLCARIKDIQIDLRYASVNNFMHRKMYPSKTNFSFLRLPVANALHLVQEKLKQKGLGLKIFDAYRPYDVTKKFWELVHDERYVANPAKGSGHNRGIAVDLTIIDLQTKQELNMGTGFDNFSDSAHQSFINFPQQVLDNRKLLKQTMQQFGFIPLETEWWHYSWPHAEQFEILNISFKELKKISN
ncbi:D-alanyl-D-alanine dipeptidase [mine drainage metagenome]|uniref:D-alanyl-D-alanine dipeptidase n=1 Tax=mine drainage metagenome TaxID=410659 RepID=A0A1J5RXR3_9ZZZZ